MRATSSTLATSDRHELQDDIVHPAFERLHDVDVEKSRSGISAMQLTKLFPDPLELARLEKRHLAFVKDSAETTARAKPKDQLQNEGPTSSD